MAGRNCFNFVFLIYIIYINMNQSHCQNVPDLQICDMGYSPSNNVIVTDGTDSNRQYTREECACRIIRRVQAAIRIIKVETTCEPFDAWKFEIIVDGCLRHTFQCSDPVDSEYTITNTSTDRDIHLILVKAYDDAEGLYYRFNVSSTTAQPSTPSSEIIETQCGIEPSSIPEYDCSPFPSPPSSTTSRTMSTSPMESISRTVSPSGEIGESNEDLDNQYQKSGNTEISISVIFNIILGATVVALLATFMGYCYLTNRKSKSAATEYQNTVPNDNEQGPYDLIETNQISTTTSPRASLEYEITS